MVGLPASGNGATIQVLQLHNGLKLETQLEKVSNSLDLFSYTIVISPSYTNGLYITICSSSSESSQVTFIC